MKAKITIIEDEEDLRNLIQKSLQAAGYEVEVKQIGYNLAVGKGELSDLYIIDLNLGGLNGLDLCKELKSKRRNVSPPVIIITSANPDVRELAIEACADDALPKPFTTKELLEKISKHLPQAEPLSSFV